MNPVVEEVRVRETEVVEKAKRRRFTAEDKRRILKEADRCTKPGEVGALLRREGVYSSLLSVWRRQREAGGLAALAPSAVRRPAHGTPAGMGGVTSASWDPFRTAGGTPRNRGNFSDESGALGVHQKFFGHCGFVLLAGRQRDVQRLTSRRRDGVNFR
ncbi:transposase [Corallococcus sp. NCSPR001]|nr:transposase [Corallococcus sp. NCSPR001]MBN9685229.1 transposase [Corallococcus sp. NCSPR001]WAS83313.1 transposase [Corallococcus sp. NCRR]